MPTCNYFHASSSSFRPGETVKARSTPRANYEFEHLIDRFAPPGAPKRVSSLFLGTRPGELLSLGADSLAHIYSVEPVGKSIRVDANWVVRAHQQWVENGKRLTPAIRKAIENYWAGKRSDTFHGWELVAPAMYVCGELAEGERQRALDETERRHPGLIDTRIFNRMITYAAQGKSTDGAKIARDLGLTREGSRKVASRTTERSTRVVPTAIRASRKPEGRSGSASVSERLRTSPPSPGMSFNDWARREGITISAGDRKAWKARKR